MALRAHLFKIDGRVLGGVLVQVLFSGVTVRAHVRILTVGHRGGGMQFGVLVLMVLWDAVCGEPFEVLVTVRAHVCDIDARVLR